MAMVKRVRRLANPRRATAKRRNATALRKRKAAGSGKRKMSAKQIKFFGTKRQKAALKAARKRKRTTVAAKVAVATNPRRKPVRRKRKTSRRNPALVVTLGQLVNPRRRKNMARRKRRVVKSTRRRVRRSRKAYPVAVAANPRRRRRYARRNPARRRSVRRRRNPDVFGARPLSGGGLKLIAGGLVGVAAAKFLPRLIPGNITATMGNFGGVVATGVSAYVASLAAGKFMGTQFGQAVLFGGLMQTGSVVLNMVLPGFAVGGVPLALSGMGDLVPGSFVVPQNPLRSIPAPAPATNARVNLNGLNRAFGTAF